MTLATLLILLIKTSLITLMVGLGLGLEIGALAAFRHRPWLILRVLLGTCVLVPLAGLALLNLPIRSHLSIGARFGIALMALCPSAPLTLRKADIQGGDRHLAALLQMLAALVAIVSIPLLSDVFRAVHHLRGWDISPKTVALQVAFVQVLPLTVGLLVRHWFPQQGARWAISIQKGATVVTLAVVGVVLLMMSPKLLTFLAANLAGLAAMGAMTATALGVGYVLARGSSPSQRTTTALVTSMRNPGLALLIAITHGEEIPGVRLAIVTYLLVTILASIPFLRWSKAQRAI